MDDRLAKTLFTFSLQYAKSVNKYLHNQEVTSKEKSVLIRYKHVCVSTQKKSLAAMPKHRNKGF